MRMSGGYEEKVSLMWEGLKHIWSQAHEHLNIPLLCFCELLFLKKKKVIFFGCVGCSLLSGLFL